MRSSIVITNGDNEHPQDVILLLTSRTSDLLLDYQQQTNMITMTISARALTALLAISASASINAASSSSVDDVNDNNALKRHNEFLILEGHGVRQQYHSPLPYTYIAKEDLPANFDWRSVDGVSYTTHSLNQVRSSNRRRCCGHSFSFSHRNHLNKIFLLAFNPPPPCFV
jgi:hypothetical protein